MGEGRAESGAHSHVDRDPNRRVRAPVAPDVVHDDRGAVRHRLLRDLEVHQVGSTIQDQVAREGVHAAPVVHGPLRQRDLLGSLHHPHPHADLVHFLQGRLGRHLRYGGARLLVERGVGPDDLLGESSLADTLPHPPGQIDGIALAHLPLVGEAPSRMLEVEIMLAILDPPPGHQIAIERRGEPGEIHPLRRDEDSERPLGGRVEQPREVDDVPAVGQ